MPGRDVTRAVKRRLVNLLTALSLLLFVAACVLWARSYIVSERLVRSHWRVFEWKRGDAMHERYFTMESGRGIARVSVFNNLTRRVHTLEEVEQGLFVVGSKAAPSRGARGWG